MASLFIIRIPGWRTFVFQLPTFRELMASFGSLIIRTTRSRVFAAIEQGSDEEVLRLATPRRLRKARGEWGQSPLVAAIAAGRSELACLLVSLHPQNSKIKSSATHLGFSPLGFAALHAGRRHAGRRGARSCCRGCPQVWAWSVPYPEYDPFAHPASRRHAACTSSEGSRTRKLLLQRCQALLGKSGALLQLSDPCLRHAPISGRGRA